MYKIGIRRVAAVIMAVLMLAVNVTAVAEYHAIEPKLLASLDVSASEWYKDEEHRALFAAVAMFDIVLYGNDELNTIVAESIASDAVYVEEEEAQRLYLYCFGPEDGVLATYTPATDTMEAEVVEGMSSLYASATMESLKSSGTITSYYKIKGSDILAMMELIKDAAEE